MKCKPMAMVLMISSGVLAVPATASEIYKQVDEHGVVHFTDQPAPEATAVEVDPNVVEVTPVKPLEPLAPDPVDRQEKPQSPDPVAQSDETQHSLDEDDFYYEGNVRKRRLLIKERLENRDNPAQLPVQRPIQTPVQRPVVR